MAPEQADRLGAVLEWALPETGQLPPLWHWAYFPLLVGYSALGEDGHARRPGWQLAEYPWRMAAAGTVKWLGPLRIGVTARRRTSLRNMCEKEGRSGPLLFTEWLHVVEQGSSVVLEEEQTVVYRASSRRGTGSGPAPASRETKGPQGDSATLRRTVRFDPVLLFQFSAVTWNSHRIHYDLPYATEVEGYPRLVVHGPLLAMLLVQQAVAELGELSRLEFRAQTPVFEGEIVELHIPSVTGEECLLEARHTDGVVAMSMRARPKGGVASI